MCYSIHDWKYYLINNFPTINTLPISTSNIFSMRVSIHNILDLLWDPHLKMFVHGCHCFNWAVHKVLIPNPHISTKYGSCYFFWSLVTSLSTFFPLSSYHLTSSCIDRLAFSEPHSICWICELWKQSWLVGLLLNEPPKAICFQSLMNLTLIMKASTLILI